MGGAALLTGAIFQILANAASRREEQAVEAAPGAGRSMREAIVEHNLEARRNTVLAQVSWAVAATGLLTGGTLLVVRWAAPEAMGPVSATAAPGGLGVGGVF